MVKVRELCAPDPAAARALWGLLVDLDLTAKVEVGCLAVDDPIVHLLVDVRAAEPDWQDNLWVRLLDVPAALAGRRYAAPVDVVLEVRDAVLPANAGRWRLPGGPAGAEVAATDAPADLALDVRELGAAYLGGQSLAALAGAGPGGRADGRAVGAGRRGVRLAAGTRRELHLVSPRTECASAQRWPRRR